MTRAAIVQTLLEWQKQKIDVIENEINDLRMGMANDGKSSAGDKYETSREMAQQEIQQLSAQLATLQQQSIGLQHMQNEETNTYSQHGSILETSTHYFLLGLALGNFELNSKSGIGIGVKAPIYGQFLNLKIGDLITLGGKNHEILAVY